MSAAVGGTLIGLDNIEVLADGLDHPEGVAVGPDGSVYAGGEAGQLYRIDPDTKDVTELATTGGWILGLAVDADHNVVACDAKRGEVVRWSPREGLSCLSAGTSGRPMTTPNYVVLHDHGAYVSDSGTWLKDDGCIYAIDANGNTGVWCERLRAFPNGMALNGDGDQLYVVLSTTPAVWRIPVLSDGAAGEPELVVELPGTVPDGLAFDERGGLYIAFYRPDRIAYLEPSGELRTVAEDFQGTVLGAPTNVAFGGPGGRTLYIGSLGRWHVSRMDVPIAGLPLARPSFPAWETAHA